MFRFLGIGKTMQYVFSLALLFFLPSLYNTLTVDGNSTLHLPGFDTASVAIMLPVFITFMYIFNAGIIFLKISVLAGIALLLAKLLKRKLPYRQSWRLTAFSITMPTLIFGLETLFYQKIPYGTFVDFIIAMLFIVGSIGKIPQPKKRS